MPFLQNKEKRNNLELGEGKWILPEVIYFLVYLFWATTYIEPFLFANGAQQCEYSIDKQEII